MYGTQKYRESVGRGIELALIAGKIIDKLPYVELIRPPSLSCVLFRRKGWNPKDYTEWTYKNHKAQYAFVTPTRWKDGETIESVARFCFINPDTTEADIQGILDTME